MMDESQDSRKRTKYLDIVEGLRTDLGSGKYRPGARLPSEAELVRKFAVSRMTVVKAIQQLQQEGLVSRRPGSGTYASGKATEENRVFGLLIPDLGQTEIFEPICRGMMRSPSVKTHSLSWGHARSNAEHKEEEAEHLCNNYIEQGVAGVFFAPLEFTPHHDEVNERILGNLNKARIPVVLLDRDYPMYPGRSTYDVVSLDHHRAGYTVTAHLIQKGAKRIAFFARPHSAQTVNQRIVGYREALFTNALPVSKDLVIWGDPSDVEVVESVLRTRPDAIMCANDDTAANLMKSMIGMGVRIPEDVRLAGIDDVRYASLLPIPLTTLHQPCEQIGSAAISAMLDRVNQPHLPPRSILLDGHLVVRSSCGNGVQPLSQNTEPHTSRKHRAS